MMMRDERTSPRDVFRDAPVVVAFDRQGRIGTVDPMPRPSGRDPGGGWHMEDVRDPPSAA